MRVVIIGAGGHAQVVADILLCLRRAGEAIEIMGYLDDAERLHGKVLLGIPVLGPLGELSQVPHDGIIVAIGSNRTRARIFEGFRKQGEKLVQARHPHSVIAADVTIGDGCMICAGAVVNCGTILGDNIILNTGCTVDHHGRIGDHAHIAPGVHTGGEVEIGEGALVGLGASVMPACRIGSWSVVGAGALVNRDLPDETTARGVPARVGRRK